MFKNCSRLQPLGGGSDPDLKVRIRTQGSGTVPYKNLSDPGNTDFHDGLDLSVRIKIQGSGIVPSKNISDPGNTDFHDGHDRFHSCDVHGPHEDLRSVIFMTYGTVHYIISLVEA